MNKKEQFLAIFHAAEKRFGNVEKRLAADEWAADWQTLIATVMSAQTRDEVTIPVAESLFKRYTTLQSLAHAKVSDILIIIKRVNFSRVKSRNVVAAAQYVVEHFNGKIPDDLDKLIEIPGVGRKTANLVISEVHAKDGITVDTHVHRIANVLGLVKTKNPTETEFALMKLAPRRYWRRINRLFVLWGKTVRGRDKKRLMAALQSKS